MDLSLLVAFLGLVDLALAIGVTVHAVLWKRDHRSAIGWVALAWLAPIVGSLAYLILGINRIKRRARLLRLVRGTDLSKARWALPISREATGVEALVSRSPDLLGLASAITKITGRPLEAGNRVTPLVDGDSSFPEMLSAIEGAEASISLLTYIFDHDRIGKRFAAALAAAQRRGVEVRVLLDSVGARYSRPSMVERLARDRVPVERFLPTRLPRLPRSANLRNHRKILVVDGRTGFTGGTNIREGHALSLNPKAPTRCIHFKVEGPIVKHLQRAFTTDWAFATGEVLDTEAWFPKLEGVGPVVARGIEDGPDEDLDKLPEVLASALAAARNRVRIVTPYFLPSSPLIAALNTAALRGVDVQVFLPSTSNIALVHWAATAQLWQILGKGCRVFYTPEPFDHTKLMIVDDDWTLLGSTNWDPRSLRLNFEFNVECYCPLLAAELNEVISDRVREAREVTSEDVDGRAFPIRLRDGLARLLTPYL